MELEILKNSLFEAYYAGFESGMKQNEDIVTAYEKWWDTIIKDIKNNI